MEKENYGLIHEEKRPEDYILGSEDKLGGSIWKPLISEINGELNWENYEPTHELQRKNKQDTNACVSFSGNNVFEYLANKLINEDEEFEEILRELKMLDENGNVNASDRRTAKGSGTDPNRGNTVRAVDDYMRKFFYCPEDLYPFDPNMDRGEYYKVMTAEIADYGKNLKPYFELETKHLPTDPKNFYNYYSTPDQIWEGLQYSPVWVSVMIPYEYDENKLIKGDKARAVLKQGGRPYGHRVTVRGGVRGKYWEVHDHYKNQIHKFDWKYPFGGAKIMKILKKNGICDAPYIKVGNAILYLGLGGSFKGEYVAFESGDVLKSIFGKYSKAIPRTKLPTMPLNYKGKKLIIK